MTNKLKKHRLNSIGKIILLSIFNCITWWGKKPLVPLFQSFATALGNYPNTVTREFILDRVESFRLVCFILWKRLDIWVAFLTDHCSNRQREVPGQSCFPSKGKNQGTKQWVTVLKKKHKKTNNIKSVQKNRPFSL